MLNPSKTLRPDLFPLGFVPLSGEESIDTILDIVQQGHFVAPERKIEVIHNAYYGLRKLLNESRTTHTFDDVVELQCRKKELCQLLLIRRDFWSLDDFNDAEISSSFGVQNLYFDNLKWSKELWKYFQQYVERWFPLSDHSHLIYGEYMDLIRSFAQYHDGVHLHPVLPRHLRIHPLFGVEIPSKLMREPLMLLKTWIMNFRLPLMLTSCLAIRGGCGTIAMLARFSGIPMVRMTDPRPAAIESARIDTVRFGKKFANMGFDVSPMFPDRRDRRYSLICFYPDHSILEAFGDQDDEFAPGFCGVEGDYQRFFEGAQEFLLDSGVLAIVTTNFYSLAHPSRPHPIEYEIRVNRRWVLLDYYDCPMQRNAIRSSKGSFDSGRVTDKIKGKLRCELWILHKLESMKEFAYIHKVPGAHPPSHIVSHWRHKGLSTHRRRVMKHHVEMMGGDWGDFKQRILHMLQEGGDEDDVAEAVRMSMDPTYPSQLALKAQASVEEKLNEQKRFHEDVLMRFENGSPRSTFDASMLKELVIK
jgi:hypothetical protein